MRVGEAEGDPEGDGRRTLANGWESRLWRLEDKHLREGSSVMQFGRPRPLRIRHRRRRIIIGICATILAILNGISHKQTLNRSSQSLEKNQCTTKIRRKMQSFFEQHWEKLVYG